jgi:hypothetical protein
MTEIASENRGAAATALKRDQHIGGATAQVKRASIGPIENVGYPIHQSRAPSPIEVERQQVIQQIVAAGNAPEHSTDPTGRFLLARSATRRGADNAHRVVEPMESLLDVDVETGLDSGVDAGVTTTPALDPGAAPDADSRMDWMDSMTNRWSIPETTRTLPICVGNTK